MYVPISAEDEKKLAQCDPKLREIAENVLKHVNAPGKLPNGIELRVHTAYRSPEEQLEAFNRGASKLKKSKHNLKPCKAVDLVFKVNGKWSWDTKLPWWMVGYWAEKYGGRWGGRWGTSQSDRRKEAREGMALGWDCPHIEIA